MHQSRYAAHLQSVLGAMDAAMASQQLDTLVVQAGDCRLAFQDDQALPFRTNPWFAWLLPLPAAPGSLVELRRGHRPRLLFTAPDDYWHSPPAPPSGAWTAHFDIEMKSSGAAALASLQRSNGEAAWLGETPPEGPWLVNPAPLMDLLVQARCLKSGYEIACLREATRIATRGHRAAEQAFRNGASEFDIHLAYLGATRQPDAALPYPAIIALNEHCATLHYQLRDERAPTRVLSMLIDAGASFQGYGSDITRTYAMLPGAFADLVEGMHGLQRELCEAVAPGIDWRDLHLRAHRLVAHLLHESGVLRIGADDAVTAGISSAFLPHGLGHLLGVQVHDVGGFTASAGSAPIPRPPGHPALRLTRRLEPGMVVTVEPGLYFIDSLLQRVRDGVHAGSVNWTKVESLRGCGGIRIEDNVVVTTDGHENLTRTAFADVA